MKYVVLGCGGFIWVAGVASIGMEVLVATPAMFAGGVCWCWMVEKLDAINS